MDINLINKKVLVALRIRETMQTILKKHGVETVFNLDAVNPFYNQTDETAEGFICEYSYSAPEKIYTPLGYLSIFSNYLVNNTAATQAIKEIEDVFGFVSCTGTKETSNCAVYNITKLPWETSTLRSDCFERELSDYIDYAVAMDIYKNLT